MRKDLAVARAVHGLQAITLFLDVKGEHVLLVVTPMTRNLPEVGLVDIGSHDLDETTLLVLALDEVQQGVVDTHTVGQEEGRAGRNLIEEEELLVLANLSVVALGSLSKEVLVLLELLLVRERNTSNSLHGLVGAVTEPVGGRILYSSQSSMLHATIADTKHTLRTEKALMLPV